MNSEHKKIYRSDDNIRNSQIKFDLDKAKQKEKKNENRDSKFMSGSFCYPLFSINHKSSCIKEPVEVK